MKKTLVLLFSAFTLVGYSQNRPSGPPSTPPPGAPSGAPTPGLPGAKKEGPKPYKEVITEKAVTKKGLFIVHKVEDKYYFEMGDSMMKREIMAITRFVKVPANKGTGRATYGGELTNQQTIVFEKGPNLLKRGKNSFAIVLHT